MERAPNIPPPPADAPPPPIPPPPPPPGGDMAPGRTSLSSIKSEQLMLKMKRLKRPEERKKLGILWPYEHLEPLFYIKADSEALRSDCADMQADLEVHYLDMAFYLALKVHVSREDCFDKFHKYNHIPLVDSREYIRTIFRADIVSISLDGVEQLTDAFLFSLYHCKISLPLLEWISLAGCYNVTDEGVFWVSLVFPSMQRLSVEGCRKVTEKSLFYLRQHNSSMKIVNMAWTSCGVLPLDTWASSSKEKQIEARGCPLISPDIREVRENPTEKPDPIRKMVILTNSQITIDPLTTLTNQKGEHRTAFVYKTGWKPFANSQKYSAEMKDISYNIFQISQELGITDLFLTPGTLVVLPFMVPNNNWSQTAAELASHIISVLTKCEDCTFALLGLCEEKSNCNELNIIQDMYDRVEKRVSVVLKEMSRKLKDGIYTNWRMEALGFHEQQILANGIRLRRQTAQLFKVESKKLPVPLIDAIGVACGVLRTGEQSAKNLQFLEQLITAEGKLFPWLRQPLKPQKAWHASDDYSTFTPLVNLCSSKEVKKTFPEHPLGKLEKSLSLSAMKGQALFYPEMFNKPMVSDFPFLSELFDKLFIQSAPRTCDIRCLGNAIPCWKFKDIADLWPNATKRQLDTLIHILEKHGCMIRFVLDEWSTIRDVSHVYVCYKDFPATPPPHKTSVWPEDEWVWSVHKEKAYVSFPGLPQSFFPNVIRHALKLGGHVCVWRDGVVIDKGSKLILIERMTTKDDQTAILVQVRTMSFSDDLSINSTWLMLNIYTRIVDHLAQKSRIYLAKMVPCIVCSVSMPIAELLPRMFMEHTVRSGDNRVHLCACGNASNANVQLGNMVSVKDLVPIHEQSERALKESKGWTSGNYINRCLMCNNCAADGDQCKINLLNGIKNRHCDCERRGTVCDSCGMCSRCTLYLTKIATSLEPMFDAPKSERYAQDQLQALDKVAVTEKGSILGFIEANVTMPLETNTLHPAFCPQLNITLIKEGHICIKLNLMYPQPLVLWYNSSSGVILKSGQEECAADAARALELGDTLGVSLSYTMISWKQRLPSCQPLASTSGRDNLYGEPQPKKLFVGNLPNTMKQDELIEMFSQHGKVEETIIAKSIKGVRKGFGFVLFEDAADAERVIKKILDQKLQFIHNGTTLVVAQGVIEHRSFTHMEVALKKNGVVIYSFQMPVQDIEVSLSNEESEGVFVQIETPGKFRADTTVLEDVRKHRHCGKTVTNLPSGTEMKMFGMIDSIEDLFYGGAGISLSGASVITLPSQITPDNLKYPSITALAAINYHHLCLSWNPLGGKGRKMRQRTLAKESKEQNMAAVFNHHSTYEYWNMSRLIHLVDSEGIPATLLTNVDSGASFFLLCWHLIFQAYPKVLLPVDTPRLLPGITMTSQSVEQVTEGLRELVRAGFWQYQSRSDIQELEKIFKPTNSNKPAIGNRKKIATYTMTFQENLETYKDRCGLDTINSRFNRNLELFMCSAHSKCLRTKDHLSAMPPELFGNYAVYISFLDLCHNRLTEIPELLFEKLVNLVDLRISYNFIEELPASVANCKKLTSIALQDNNLTTLPDEMEQLKSLMQLEVGGNRFTAMPPVICRLTGLRKLLLNHMMLTELPEDIGNLTNLRFLGVQGNCFTKVPKRFSELEELEELFMGAIPYVKVPSNKKVLTFENFQTFLKNKNIERWIEASAEDRRELFYLFDDNANGVLEENEKGKLNAVIFNLFPRFGYKGKEVPDDQTVSGFPSEILGCTKLKVLSLSHHGFTHVPKEIQQLEKLVDLNISFNPNLLSIPAELGLLPSLSKLGLDDCPLLKTPPHEIRKKGFHSCMAYLQRLTGGAVKTKRTKLMMVGLGGAGKTSLVEALMSDSCKADLQQGGVITDGIDIKTWNVNHNDDSITYNVWDFAGQTVYYNTHQFFLSTNRAIYFLLWNVRLGYEHAGLDFWLNSIKVQAPNTPIFVVGSHIDQVSKPELPLEEIQAKYPQIAGFHFVSSYSGQGIAELKDNLFKVTLQQKYMGEDIPSVWLRLEKMIKKESQDIVEFEFIKHIANKSGIFDEAEIFEAVQFLHDLGSVQHFTNDFLKTKVVINPQWIVDAMACVVSVKADVVKEGRLHHHDITSIWTDYHKKLHQWLLRLTEEFDLTFPLNDEPINLVPCLLPDKKPKFPWPELEKGTDLRENKIVYRFDYLPAGLFNRGQVRLHNLSDSSRIWKKGSFLKKNFHIALVQQTRDSELEVIVQGPRPENILFLVHEVFESLIAESFQGVKYDFSMPCPDCQRMLLKDPHMFDASTIRRAIDMNAPFLQCVKSFHTISCSILLTLLPPDSHSDFDVHLVQTVQGLKDLRKDLSTDIFISCNVLDTRLDENVYITPGKVYKTLVDQGFRCWIDDFAVNQSIDESYKPLVDCSVLLAFVSSNYANDEECVTIFKFAKLTLKKKIVVVAIGDGFEWKTSKLGILLADEVFINMIKAKYDFFDQKYEELVTSLKGKVQTVVDMAPKPAVFFSYTWVNSEDAVSKGTRSPAGALGYGDPRVLKDYLEQNGISCWIDVERVGMNGLFDDIAEGLLSAKVVIVCVSDEYAGSPTCQLEFRYAANTLKLPIIMVVVGTGSKWRAEEVGLLSVKFPLVNFQEETKAAWSKLLKMVKERLGEPEDPMKKKAQKDAANRSNKNLSYQELFELAQRKLLRQLMMFAEHQQDVEVYPRLFVVDIVKDRSENIDTTDDEDGGEKMLNAQREEKKKKRPLSSRHSSTMLPAYRLQKFCVYTLCEHDECWHSVAEPIELPSDFGLNELTTYSPYLARMTTVMKYSKKMVLNCLTDEVGEDYLNWLEKSPDATMSDYQMVYHQFREMVRNADTDLKMGGLMRCHLTNGRTVWLCQKHRESMRVTCLSNEDKSSSHVLDTNDTHKNWMLSSLRSMEKEVYSNRFQSVPLAKRLMRDDAEDDDEVDEDDIDGEKPKKKVTKAKKKDEKRQKDSGKPAVKPEKVKEPVKSVLKPAMDGVEAKSKLKGGRQGVSFAMQADTVIEAEMEDNTPEERPSSSASQTSQTSDVSRQSSVEQGQVSSTSSSQLRTRSSGSRRKPLGSQPIYGTKGGEKSSRACSIS